jgi:hypothetical protein
MTIRTLNISAMLAAKRTIASVRIPHAGALSGADQPPHLK